MTRPVAPYFRLFVVGLAAVALGCPASEPEMAEETEAPRAAVALKLLVVDDPGMSDAIERLGAEWKAQTGGSIAVSQVTSTELAAADSLPGSVDAVIYPSAELGSLVEREWVASLPPDYSANRELAWSDTFELLQLAATTWGRVPHAVPFGSPVLVCYYRSDLLEAIHKEPPQTWEEYHELAEMLSRRENLGDAAPAADAEWHATAEPLAEGWAAAAFLARAAAYAKHRDNYSTLFDIETMEPLVAGPAFVRALEQLVADAKFGPPNQLELNPDAVRREFLAGRVGLAITWPGHASAGAEKPTDAPPPTGFAELPGAREMYNVTLGTWDKRHADESPRVPLVGLAGRLGSVTRSTSHPGKAFQLLAWLSGRQWGPTVSAASPATTLYRRSQIKSPRPWLDPRTDAAAAQQYATTVYDALSHQAYLLAPRIPGHTDYMHALDAAVRAAASGDKSPADALTAAAAQWRKITDEHGTDAQRKAYRLSLGLEP